MINPPLGKKTENGFELCPQSLDPIKQLFDWLLDLEPPAEKHCFESMYDLWSNFVVSVVSLNIQWDTTRLCIDLIPVAVLLKWG